MERLNFLGGREEARPIGMRSRPALQMLSLLLLLLFGPKLAEAYSKKVPATWPWQASIFMDTRYRCEGALVSQEWVLTGANCFGSWPLSRFTVTLGPDRLALDTYKNKSSVKELLLSPGGSGGLALARLASPPPLSSAVQPVPLATQPKPLFPWQLCWAQGFEPDFDPYIPPRELHRVLLKPLHLSTCKDTFRTQPDCPDLKVSLPKGSQCARPPAGPPELVVSDGTPLVCLQASRWLLKGVMTWGPCLGPGLPEVYTPVYPFIFWIWEKVFNTTFNTKAKASFSESGKRSLIPSSTPKPSSTL